MRDLVLNLKTVTLATGIFCGCFFAKANATDFTPSDITDIILVTGQSNVTGSQTQYDPILDASNDRIFAFTSSGDWEVADLHQAWDVDGWHPGNGSLQDPTRSPYNNLAFQFAKSVVQNDPDRVVGIVVAGAPGEGIQHWDANSSFSQTVETKVLAAINAHGIKSELDGILWHQGETDWQFHGTSDPDASTSERSDPEYYPDKLNGLIARFRNQNWFSNQKPFICGETKQAPVNARLMNLNADGDSWTACVAASDLTTREMDLSVDPPVLGTHFDAAGLRTLGQRYGLKYSSLTERQDKADTTAPTASVVAPSNGSELNAGLLDITGTATDAESGVNRIRVQVRQVGISPLLFWDGDDWVAGSVYLDANLEDDGAWTLPDVDLSEAGSYRILLWASDQAGNIAPWRDHEIGNFLVRSNDSTLPTAQITAPASSSVLSPSVVDITGTASDSESGIDRVRVQVRQVGISPLLFWDGDDWVTRSVFVTANLEPNGNWTLPDVELSEVGSYRILLWARDRNGNIASWSNHEVGDFLVRSNDNTPPSAQIAVPTMGSVLDSGGIDVKGTATDAGSGVDRVRVQVRQVGISPLLFWDGDDWVTRSVFLDANLEGDGSWTLPDVELSESGRYRILLWARDGNGNIAGWRDHEVGDFLVQ